MGWGRHSWKQLGYLGSVLIPMLPPMGMVIGTAWLTPLLFFLLFPAAGRVLGEDRSTPTSTASKSVLNYLDWIPRLYLPVWAASLVYLMQFVQARDLSAWDAGGVCLSAGVMSGLATCIAHELLHRRAILDRRLADMMTWLFGYPHFIIDHLTHHQSVGDPRDGGTPYAGESSWCFVVRNARSGFRCAWRIEAFRPLLRRRTVRNALASVCILWTVGAVIGPRAAALFAFQCAFAFLAVQLITYIQHYGLIRMPGEAPAANLSWADNCVIANCLTLNNNHHSHHHLDADLPYYMLRTDRSVPRLPASYMIMLLIALVPAWWRKLVDPRLVEYMRARDSGKTAGCAGAIGDLLR